MQPDTDCVMRSLWAMTQAQRRSKTIEEQVEREEWRRGRLNPKPSELRSFGFSRNHCASSTCQFLLSMQPNTDCVIGLLLAMAEAQKEDQTIEEQVEREEWRRGRLNPKPLGLRIFGFSRTLLCSLLHFRDSLKRKEGRGVGGDDPCISGAQRSSWFP
jgi:hypothetical protein